MNVWLSVFIAASVLVVCALVGLVAVALDAMDEAVEGIE